MPISSAPTPSDTSVVVRISDRRSKLRSRIGSAARRSTATKTAKAATPMPKQTKLDTDAHAHALPPSSSPRISAVRPIVSDTAPA